ncbi:MAG: hypothetical protein AAF750_10865 [Planctomycetota bacterium]
MIKTDPIPFDRPDEEMAAQVPERFVVRDEASANWVARRITEARAYAKRVHQWAEQENAEPNARRCSSSSAFTWN